MYMKRSIRGETRLLHHGMAYIGIVNSSSWAWKRIDSVGKVCVSSDDGLGLQINGTLNRESNESQDEKRKDDASHCVTGGSEAGKRIFRAELLQYERYKNGISDFEAVCMNFHEAFVSEVR
jgi:hypothetical protein